MFSASQYALLKLSKTKSPQKLFPSDHASHCSMLSEKAYNHNDFLRNNFHTFGFSEIKLLDNLGK